jgi:hypothetical protein
MTPEILASVNLALWAAVLVWCTNEDINAKTNNNGFLIFTSILMMGVNIYFLGPPK